MKAKKVKGKGMVRKEEEEMRKGLGLMVEKKEVEKMRKGLSVIAGIAILLFAYSASAGVYTNGLISWWKFDETTGTSASDYMGTEEAKIYYGDYSQSVDHVYWTNDTAGTASSGALWFQASDTNMGDVATHTNYDTITANTACTIEAWIKPFSTGADERIIERGNNGPGWGMHFDHWSGTKIDAVFHLASGTNMRMRSEEFLIPTGVWTHIAATYDGTTNAKLYVNGVDETTYVVNERGSGAFAVATNQYVRLGHYHNTTEQLFDGIMDDVRIYSSALTQEQVQQNYNAIPEPSTLLLLGGGLLGLLTLMHLGCLTRIIQFEIPVRTGTQRSYLKLPMGNSSKRKTEPNGLERRKMKRNSLHRLSIVVVICFWGITYLNAEEAIKVIPRPLSLTVRKGDIELTEKSAMVIGNKALPQERYAAQSIKKELKEFHKLNLPILSEGDNLKNCDNLILIGQPDTNKKVKEFLESTGTNFPFSSGDEGFLIKVTKDDNRDIVLIAGSDSNGVIYGCYAFLKLLKNDGENIFVPMVEISDKPSIKWRIDLSWITAEDVLKNANYNFEKWKIFYLDWLARWGVNVLPVWTHAEYLYPGESSPSPITKELVREAHLRGIKVMPVWNYLYYFEKQGKCLTNDKDVEDVLKELKSYIDAGVDKLLIMCDDIADWTRDFNYCHCAKCQAKFGDPGTEQLFLMEKVVKLVKETNPKIDIYFCPTNYSGRGFEEMGDQLPDPVTYNKKIASSPFMKDVKKFYAFFRAKHSDRVKELGLTNYVFWYNGVRPRMSYLFTKIPTEKNKMFASFYGFTNYYWGWDTVNASPQISSIELAPDTVSEMATLPQRTDSILLCTGGGVYPHEYISALNGIFTWHPETFSQEEAEGEIVNSIFGRGSYDNHLKEVNRVYHAALDYYLTSPDHTPATTVKGKEVLEEIPKALNLLNRAKGTYKIEGGHLPEKITQYYFREFEKALNLVSDEVKTLCKEEEQKWSSLSDQISFGYRHWKKSSGDIYDKEADAKDIDDSMGEHKAKAINETVGELQCKGVEWTFSTPKPGDYSVVMSLLVGGARLANFAYKIGDRWFESPIGKGLPEACQTVTLPVSIPRGQTETRFRFNAINWAYIFNASLFFSKERTDIAAYQKIDSLKFGTKYKSEMEKHQTVYKVHTESKEQLGGSSGWIEWQFITPKGGKFFINLTVVSGPERKSQLTYNAGEEWIELPEIAPAQDALREIVFPIEVPATQEKTSFRWRVTSGFSYLLGAEILREIPGK